MNLIKSIVSSTRRYNLHSHTQYCDGRFPMSQMAEAAVAAGMEHYAFTPHSPLPIESPCNMSLDDVPQFIAESEELKCRYRGRIHLYTGMEIDYLSPQYGPHIGLFADMPLQVRIGSVHFVPTQQGEPVDCDGSAERFAVNLHKYFGSDLRYVVEKYFGQVMEMLQRGGMDIVGHFDKIAANASAVRVGIEQEGWYQNLMDTTIAMLAEKRYAVEINTKAYEKSGRFFPNPACWRRLAEAGLTLAVNSDAHYVDKINAGREEAFNLFAVSMVKK